MVRRRVAAGGRPLAAGRENTLVGSAHGSAFAFGGGVVGRLRLEIAGPPTSGGTHSSSSKTSRGEPARLREVGNLPLVPSRSTRLVAPQLSPQHDATREP